jgi:hypothetical protein
MSTADALLQDINQRLTAIGETVSETRLKQLVADQLNLLFADDKFVRKMRFGGERDARLEGTKYARWGLGLADIEFLYELMESAHGAVRGHNGPSETLRNTFNAISEAYYLPEAEVRKMDQRAIDNLFPRIAKSALHLFAPQDRVKAKAGAWELTDAYRNAVRAMDTAESGYGSQLVGAQYVGELWDAARRESRIFGLLNTFEMMDPTAYLPVEVDFPEMLFVGESTASNSSNYTTSKTGSQRVAVTAKKFVIHQMWSGEMEEDSIIPFVPFLRRQVALALAHYSDSVVLNGDDTNAATGNINLDDADPADTKHYLAFDGIRHAGLVDNTGNSLNLAGPITLAAMSAARGRMVDSARFVDWGHPFDKDDLIYTSDIDTADALAALDEVTTVDKYGPQATVLNGELGRVLGHPLIASMAMSKTEADGKVSTTGGNNVKGQVVTFNRKGFIAGWRRRVKSEVERLSSTDQTRMVYSLRMGLGRFTPTGAASGIEAADVIYNISL